MFRPFGISEKLYIGISTLSKIKCQGKEILKMNSRKELTLINVLYILEICKNLLFRSPSTSMNFK